MCGECVARTDLPVEVEHGCSTVADLQKRHGPFAGVCLEVNASFNADAVPTGMITARPTTGNAAELNDRTNILLLLAFHTIEWMSWPVQKHWPQQTGKLVHTHCRQLQLRK